VSALLQSTHLDPRALGPHLKLAAVLEQMQRKDEARTEWQRALEIDPTSVDALHGLSRHFIADGDYGSTITLLRSSTRNEVLTLDLAEAYAKAGMLKDADDLLSRALAQKSGSLPLVSALTTVEVDEGFREKALRIAKQFADTQPANQEAQKLYLRNLLANNDTADAFPLARKLLTAAPRDSYLLYVMGVMERQNGDYAAARNHLEQAIALEPDAYNSHYNLGLALVKLNEPRAAKEQFEKALALGSPDPEVHVELATVLKNLGENEAAQKQVQLYRQASQAQSNQSVAQAKATLAEKELDSGDPHKAAALYREAVEATPNDSLMNYKLSVALDKAGDSAGEHEALEKAVQIDPDMAIAQNQLGYLDSRSGDVAAAEKHFREAVRAAPAYTEAWINLAATLGMESKFQEAQQAVDSALKLEPTNSEALQLRQDLAVSQSQH
jgi:Flp pilus assembly protein TadD